MAEAARRELIEAAWDKAEEKEEKEAVVEPTKEASASEEPVVKVDDAEGGTGKESTEEKPEEAYKAEQKVAATREEEPKPSTATDRAPQSWKPAPREQWGKLPSDVRAEISRREREIQQTLTQTDNVRKFANDFAQTIQPYAHLIRQSNSTPLKAVENLMQTSARLMTGSQEQKAQVLAEIIGNYGVDLATLDRVLSGVAQNGRVSPQQPEQPPGWAKPMFEFMSTVQQSREQAAEQARQSAAREIEVFAEKPFFEDLREEIADIMEIATNRGRTITLDQAYQKAVALNPEISGIIAQREKARNPVSEAAATLARARRAASTVSGAPVGTKVSGKQTPANRREAIEQAWNDAESGA